MNSRHFFAGAVVLAMAMPVRADEPVSPVAAAVPVEQMIAELKQVAELVKQLDDKSFAKRQEATQKLLQMGKPAIEPLARVLTAKPNLEMETRIRRILADLKKKQRPRNKALQDKLAQKINLDKGIDVNTPLKDALEFFADRYDLTILVDSKAFEAIGVQKVEEQPVCLPKMVGIPLRTVLILLMKQIRGDNHHGTFCIRGDRIEVTTTLYANPENWVGEQRQHAPKVDADFDSEDLEDALRSLADSTGVSVVLDRRVMDKAREPVAVALNHVPLDTAVRMLADMAGLKMVVLHNALYVTSKENAKEMEADRATRMRRERPKKSEDGKKEPKDKG